MSGGLVPLLHPVVHPVRPRYDDLVHAPALLRIVVLVVLGRLTTRPIVRILRLCELRAEEECGILPKLDQMALNDTVVGTARHIQPHEAIFACGNSAYE